VSSVGVPSDPTCFSFRLPCFTLVLSVLESLVQWFKWQAFLH
jgi:hypothetical protein